MLLGKVYETHSYSSCTQQPGIDSKMAANKFIAGLHKAVCMLIPEYYGDYSMWWGGVPVAILKIIHHYSVIHSATLHTGQTQLKGIAF